MSDRRPKQAGATVLIAVGGVVVFALLVLGRGWGGRGVGAGFFSYGQGRAIVIRHGIRQYRRFRGLGHAPSLGAVQLCDAAAFYLLLVKVGLQSGKIGEQKGKIGQCSVWGGFCRAGTVVAKKRRAQGARRKHEPQDNAEQDG